MVLVCHSNVTRDSDAYGVRLCLDVFAFTLYLQLFIPELRGSMESSTSCFLGSVSVSTTVYKSTCFPDLGSGSINFFFGFTRYPRSYILRLCLMLLKNIAKRNTKTQRNQFKALEDDSFETFCFFSLLRTHSLNMRLFILLISNLLSSGSRNVLINIVSMRTSNQSEKVICPRL